MEEKTFCPIINGECKGESCMFWGLRRNEATGIPRETCGLIYTQIGTPDEKDM
jgi:hypothetical protein